MCPDDFMGEFIIDEEETTCSDIDYYIAMGYVDWCESEEDQGSMMYYASMCCENMHMEHSSYFFSKWKRKWINTIFSLIVFCFILMVFCNIKKFLIACILSKCY